MLRSAPLTNIMKYIFPVVFPLIGWVAYQVLLSSQEVPHGFTLGFGLGMLYLMVFIIQLPLRVKKIMADDSGVHVARKEGTQLIPYTQITTVSKADLLCPWGVTIKYKDVKSGAHRSVAYLINKKHQRGIKDDLLTALIKEKSNDQNPTYQATSTMKNMGIMLLISLPIYALLIYSFLQP